MILTTVGALAFQKVAARGCIVYDVVKAYDDLSPAFADTKSDLAKAEATVESLVTAEKKAVEGTVEEPSGLLVTQPMGQV